ncbi:MAG: DUF1761 domain-containing protein [Actinomycetota bacterium]
MDLDVNWLAIITATALHQALGALWYGVLFKKLWLNEMGMSDEDVAGQGPGAEMFIGIAASLASTVVMAVILTAFPDPDVTDGVVLGALAGVGFVLMSNLMNGAYEQRSSRLSILFGAYYTLGLIAVGAVLGAWR